MRPLFALVPALLAAAAYAQPVTSVRPLATDARLVVALEAGFPDDPSDVYRGAVAGGTALGGALLGSAGAVGLLVIGTVVAYDCSPFGCGESVPDLFTPAAVSVMVGGAVGGTVAVALMTGSMRSPSGALALRPGDWRRALVGSLIGTLPGALVALAVDGSGVEWVAVPITQSIGAGIAVGL